MKEFVFQIGSTMFRATPNEAKRFAQHCADYHKTTQKMLVYVGKKWREYGVFQLTQI